MVTALLPLLISLLIALATATDFNRVRHVVEASNTTQDRCKLMLNPSIRHLVAAFSHSAECILTRGNQGHREGFPHSGPWDMLI